MGFNQKTGFRIAPLITQIYGYLVGGAVFLVLRLLGMTCRKEYVNKEIYDNLDACILTSWHHNNVPFFILFSDLKNFVSMHHPLWYMKPVHVMARLMGCKKVIPGSSGHNGKKAAGIVVDHLKQGYSTMINPDGPAGPPEVLKPGVLKMALLSGVPMVPLSIETPACLTLKSWDNKRIPLPFSRVTIRFGHPVYLTEEPSEGDARKISLSLG